MKSINITTTHSRLDLCSATIWSLMHQSILPDQINLWVSSEPYMADKGVNNIPSWYDELNNINDILRIHFVKNIGPYRKIIPALREATSDDILTYADDDVIYGHEWYESLLSAFNKYNGRYIVASRVRLKRLNVFGRLQSYNMYHVCNQDIVLENHYIVTGVGGCMLTKAHVRPDLISLDDFVSIVPRTDDIWLSKIFETSGTAVNCCASSLKYIQEITHSNNALNQSNNVIPGGGVLKKVLSKIRNKFLGYLGFSLSNNDLAIRNTDAFFDKRDNHKNVKK
nr:glycosyltransferase [Klebsiella pneumoniae]